MRQVFHFKRGEEFSCYVTVTVDNQFTFHNLVFPEGAEQEQREQLLEDAEQAVLTQLAKQELNYGTD